MRLWRLVAQAVAAALATAAGPWAEVRAETPTTWVDAPANVFPDVLDQYRRIELLAPPGFAARCERKADVLICGLDEMPPTFVRFLRAMRGGAVTKVDFRGRRGAKRFEVRLELKSPGLDFRSTMLAAPPRWVLEVGLPEAMSEPIEDETPFRPYPLAPTPFEPVLPKSPVGTVAGRGGAAEAVRSCVSAWRADRPREALALCEAAAKEAHEDAALAATAVMARAEAAAALAALGKAPDLTTVTEALAAAEAVGPTPEAKARFVLLQARSYEPMGFPARGEAHLEEKFTTYKGTPAEPWLLAGQLAGEFEAGNTENTGKIIATLQGMGGDNPNVGGAVRLAAGQAYERRDFVHALELLDSVQRRWPEQLLNDAPALFQYAETCAYFGRYDDARTLYAKYVERFPRKKPHHIARVRQADLTTNEDPLAARARLYDLALALKEPEGQHLAALHAIRLTMDPKERRRTLNQVEMAGPTDYVRAELSLEFARSALANGRLREAFERLREIWRRYPNETLLTRSPKLFERVLYLLMRNYVALDRPLAAVSTYYAERPRFEAHARREEMHLLAGRAFNRLGMGEEAYSVFQRGLRTTSSGERPAQAVEAEIYLEMADALYQMGDKFRLGEILRYLDKRYPGRFDTFRYWRARAADARWDGRLPEARDIYVYALNGPVTDDERAELAGEVAEVYADMGDTAKAMRALEARIALHDAAGRPKDSPVRRAALWRVAEVAYDGGDWAAALGALGRFLTDYPDDGNRREALFLKARALHRLGDTYSAVRLFDELSIDPKGGRFGRLAGLELELLRWERREAPGILEAAGFPRRN